MTRTKSHQVHLFEFLDQAWLPAPLRLTILETLACCHKPPFTSYDSWVATEVLKIARARQCDKIVELGAGNAPITRTALRLPGSDGMVFIPCDRVPNQEVYEDLATRFPTRVRPILTSVNMEEPQTWDERTLLVISAAFHHVTPSRRASLVRTLSRTGAKIAIFEPLRRTPLAFLYNLLSLVPACLVPLMMLGEAGTLRRVFWTWVLPLAPLMFLWDGSVSVIRQWSEGAWRAALASALPRDRSSHAVVEHRLVTQCVYLESA